MTDRTIELDQHRGMAAQKATDTRRLLADVEANEEMLRLRQQELESHFDFGASCELAGSSGEGPLSAQALQRGAYLAGSAETDADREIARRLRSARCILRRLNPGLGVAGSSTFWRRGPAPQISQQENALRNLGATPSLAP